MGRKPVLTMAGTLFTSLALAGCQSSSSARPSTQYTPPSGSTVSQNKTVTTTTGGAAVTYNGQPGSQGTAAAQLNGGFTQTSTTGQPVNGGFTQTSTTGQPGSQLAPANPNGRLTSTTSGNVVIPPNPTPATGQLPSSGLQPLPQVNGNLGTSAGAQFPGPAPSSNSNLMPTGSQTMNMVPPPVGVIGPTGSPLSVSGGVSLNTAVDVPGVPPRPMNTTSYPVLPANPATNSFGMPPGPQLQN
jgi:hypothetical protein